MTDSEDKGKAVGKAPSSFENLLSLFGLYVSSTSLFAVVMLVVLDFFGEFGNPYMGLLTYIVAPSFLMLGAFFVLFGAWRERRRRHLLAPGQFPKRFQLDLNLPRHRRNLFLAAGFAFVFLILTAIGSYRSYHYTESVVFCGQTCHSVMKPEYTAYQNSPHARVECTQCHIGPGASWFVRSKLSGTYQVYAVLAKKFPTPIPTPVKNLRPAQDTCEQCHWPKKFFGSIERKNEHYKSDNTKWTIQLLVKIGGGDPSYGPVGGIHWHMNISNRVEYIASDTSRQVIPWVRITDASGHATVFQSNEKPLTADQIRTMQMRRMDCIDCHNRPSHIYMDPDHAVDIALSTGRINRAIPSIKTNAVKVLAADYQTQDQALQEIKNALAKEYKALPDQQSLQRAIVEVQDIYSKNFFPEMKVDWKTYPNNIGHLIFPGCFRCHDGKHVSDTGVTISRDCNSCHIIISQGPTDQAQTVQAQGMPFTHPEDIGDMWQTSNCNECHTGGPM